MFALLAKSVYFFDFALQHLRFGYYPETCACFYKQIIS